MSNSIQQVTARLGYAADPAIEILLPKELLAQIKVRKIDIAIKEYQSAIDLLNVEREMLAKEYKIGR